MSAIRAFFSFLAIFSATAYPDGIQTCGTSGPYFIQLPDGCQSCASGTVFATPFDNPVQPFDVAKSACESLGAGWQLPQTSDLVDLGPFDTVAAYLPYIGTSRGPSFFWVTDGRNDDKLATHSTFGEQPGGSISAGGSTYFYNKVVGGRFVCIRHATPTCPDPVTVSDPAEPITGRASKISGSVFTVINKIYTPGTQRPRFKIKILPTDSIVDVQGHTTDISAIDGSLITYFQNHVQILPDTSSMCPRELSNIKSKPSGCEITFHDTHTVSLNTGISSCGNFSILGLRSAVFSTIAPDYNKTTFGGGATYQAVSGPGVCGFAICPGPKLSLLAKVTAPTLCQGYQGGFHVPTSSEWEAIRTELNGDTKNLFFPRAPAGGGVTQNVFIQDSNSATQFATGTSYDSVPAANISCIKNASSLNPVGGNWRVRSGQIQLCGQSGIASLTGDSLATLEPISIGNVRVGSYVYLGRRRVKGKNRSIGLVARYSNVAGKERYYSAEYLVVNRRVPE